MSTTVIPTVGPIYSIVDENQPISTHQVIKQISIEFLQLMYGENGPNTRLHWDPDINKTEIAILDKYTFNLDDVQVRPAIVANRGPQRWMSTSGFQQMQERDFEADKTISTDLVSGTIVFHCFSKNGLEAEDIAGDLFTWFRAFRMPLRKTGLFRIESLVMGEEALVKADSRPDLSVVPVQVDASTQVRWSIEPYARTLKQIVSRIGKVTTAGGSFTP